MESGKGLAGIEELLRQSTALSERLTKELGKSAQFSSVTGCDSGSPLRDPTAHQPPASLPSPLFNTVASNPAGGGGGASSSAAVADEVLEMPMPTPGMPTPLRGGTGPPGQPQQSTLRSTPAVSCPTPASRTRHPNEAGGLLDDSELHALSGQVPDDALLEAHSGSPFGFAQYDDRGSAPAAAGGPAAVPPASLPSGTGQCYRGSSVAAMDADEAEVLQSKAEAIVAALDDSQGLKQTNPYGGLSFQDLIQKISLDPNMKVYAKKVPAEKLVQGTVAEQLISVVDCEKERYLYRTRTLVEDYEARLAAMQASHEEEQERLREEFVQQREEADKNVSLMMERSKQSLKGQTEQLAREGLATHLESERTKDELALVNEDVASLKKLLFFWKKKNNVLKQQFDGNERELVLAREKLKDYHQIHEMDAYKVHRFCGQLREREMRSRWRADELEKRVRELQIENAQLKDGKSLVQPESQMFGENDITLPSHLLALAQDDDPIHVASSSRDAVGPQDASAHEHLRQEVSRSRFELSARCKLLLGLDRQYDTTNHVTQRISSCFSKDQQALAAEMTALNDGIRLRDDQVDVLMAALSLRDQTVAQLRADVDRSAEMISEIRMQRFEPFHCEDLVKENDSLQRQLNDCKDIMYNMQKQVQAERGEMAEERKTRADHELEEAKDRKQKDLTMAGKLRDRDTEIIRLRNRIQEGAGAGNASEVEVRILREEQARAELQEQVESLEDEKQRLKQYVSSLSSRLEQTLSQLSHRNQKIKQYESLTQTMTLSPRLPDVSPVREMSPGAQSQSAVMSPSLRLN